MDRTTDDPHDHAPDDRRVPLSLAELTRAAGVSPRTVRYYIAEGLLPPPVGAGPRAAYTPSHLDRLRLIGRLKGAYLPLREIRRRLAGLGDAEVRRLVEEEPPAPDAAPAHPDTAADYIGRVLGGRRPPAPAYQSRLAEPRQPTLEAWAARENPPSPSPPMFEPPPAPQPVLGRAYPAPFAPPPEEEAPAPDAAEGSEPTAADAWRRVPLGDDAELLIRESAYRRRRDRVDWLVAWAKRVFG
jgi:DNA-binding transcriptional MerR regulator